MSDGVAITTSVLEHTVNSKKWEEMNFSELLNQKNILFARYEYLTQAGNPIAAQSILGGIHKVDALIAQKSQK